MKKKKHFVHLKTFDRDRMEALLNARHNQTEVAYILKVDKSTISREKQRKREDGRYDALVAERKAQVKRGNSKYQGMKIEQNQFLRRYIVSEMKQYRSPDEIAGRMREEKWPVRVSSDAIYRWLRSAFGQRYCRYLCTKRYRKKPHSSAPKRQIIPNMVSIHNIKENVGIRTEGDTFLSPKKVSKHAGVLVGWIGVRLLKGDKVKSLRPLHTRIVMKKIHEKVKSDLMIVDRGVENREHEQFGVPTYFCDPASPRQKPFIESSIGLCRRWFWPKGTDLSEVNSEEFKYRIEILNNKYRKSLHYRSANEVARECGILK